jgi:hypothetical protein
MIKLSTFTIIDVNIPSDGGTSFSVLSSVWKSRDVKIAEPRKLTIVLIPTSYSYYISVLLWMSHALFNYNTVTLD